MLKKAVTFCGMVLCMASLGACGFDSGTGPGNRPPASNNSDANSTTENNQSNNTTSANNQTSPPGNNTSPTNNQTSPPGNNQSNNSTSANNQTSPPGNNQTGNNTSPRIIDREGLFALGVESVTLEIDYQAGAEPYTSFGILGTSGSPFRLTRANIEALFSVTTPALTIPTEISQMQEVTDVSGEDFDVDTILAIASRWRDGYSTSTDRTFYIVFLDGYFNDDSGRREGVLGVSIGNTGVIAMFKPVIDSTSSPQYVEQTTLVHEFGHAAGLVNNGVDLVHDHQDEEHGKHCSNDDCVMYWANEGASNIGAFVSRYVLDPETVIFDQDCLDDVHAAANQ
ncbi:MAG: hypothetical protein VYE40_01090 [Myxococcota bacterium]|nr:hypothetical protein [Myxococcota bacterium]